MCYSIKIMYFLTFNQSWRSSIVQTVLESWPLPQIVVTSAKPRALIAVPLTMSVIASTRTMRLATPARMDAPPAPFAARSSHGAARRPAPLAAAPASTSQPPRRAPRLVARAADPSGAPAGQVSSELMASMEAKIADALEGCKSVKVQDMYGDGRHVSIDVVADAFEGKNSVARQRMVYKVRAHGAARGGAARGRAATGGRALSGTSRGTICRARAAGWGLERRCRVPVRAGQAAGRDIAADSMIPSAGPRLSVQTRPAAATLQRTRASRPAPPQAIWFELQETVHAVDAMTTKTPAEAGN